MKDKELKEEKELREVIYKNFEDGFREYLFYFLRSRTGEFLNYVDLMLADQNMTVGTAAQVEQIKKHGKGLFMNCQDSILSAAKCLIETGEIPRGIDKRAATKFQGPDDQ